MLIKQNITVFRPWQPEEDNLWEISGFLNGLWRNRALGGNAGKEIEFVWLAWYDDAKEGRRGICTPKFM